MVATKPYLESIDDPDRVAMTIEWAQYLGRSLGASGALNALQYYERLGWIGPDARRQVAEHLQALSLDEIHNKKYDEPERLEEPLEWLSGTPFSVHARSLQYVAGIAGHDLKRSVMVTRIAEHRVEREDEPAAADLALDLSGP